MDVSNYLKRIGYDGGTDVTYDVLCELHKKHVYEIPFENLDVHYKKVFDLKITNVYKKVIVNGRGGFCYELNLLFNWMLNELGFWSKIIACRIYNDDGTLGPEFDHMAIYVKAESEFLLDVGYGDLFITPLQIKQGIQFDGRNYFQIDKLNNGQFILLMSPDGLTYSKRYAFALSEVEVAKFDQICLEKQTNPNSYFVKNVICTKPTNTGRATIFNDKLIEKIGDQRAETPIKNEESLRNCLKEKFKIIIRG